MIQTVFNVDLKRLMNCTQDMPLLLKSQVKHLSKILEPLERKSCSFERIYFSRGSDAEIYQERKYLETY